ncbi:MAG TPA: Sb-PDE family phosphodiesterase [Draconibacterium sp.]|nr:Sb-PDE family phosphodiesterase [Draconibacterium sp.]
MLFIRLFGMLILMFLIETLGAQSRKVINIPDIQGYQTLKCDFHMHTVFSDGTVWPTVRIQEAWEEGLDVISITDHIEYRPHSTDIDADHNRSYEIAEPLAKEMNIILVRGAEITRNMPPGHLNALFIRNANLLDREDVNDAIREARDQGAFLIWNHPGWKAQQPDSTVWWSEHSVLRKNNMLHGIEVFNEDFCTEAFDWAIEKNLTIFGNTDEHGPSNYEGSHRPMTLVFAKSRTQGGIKEALFNRRTAVYFGNILAGDASFLNPLFFASVEFDKKPIKLKNEESKVIFIKNNSDFNYELELAQPGIGFDAPGKINLKAGQITSIELTGNSNEVAQMKNLEVYYEVKNLKISNSDNLVITLSIQNN